MNNVSFLGKIMIQGSIEIKTGLRIGGITTGVKIGGVDQPVITDPKGKPYIPGSSLKGKLRSLLEKKEQVKIENGQHSCTSIEEYNNCPICRIWGIMGDKIKDNNAFTLTRVIIRDTYLDELSITEEMRRNMDLEWTEVKMETAIDRTTGTAKTGSLRQIERIPAGAMFKPMEILFNIFEERDKDLLMKIFEAMELLEHDYLGGMGSRGYGQIQFKDIAIFWNSKKSYTQGSINQNKISNGFTTPVEILKNFETIKENIKNES